MDQSDKWFVSTAVHVGCAAALIGVSSLLVGAALLLSTLGTLKPRTFALPVPIYQSFILGMDSSFSFSSSTEQRSSVLLESFPGKSVTRKQFSAGSALHEGAHRRGARRRSSWR